METFRGHRDLTRPLMAPAVALGNFDGVHLGHRRLLDAARAAADRLGGESVVLTFEPHPARVLAPEQAPPRITSPARKLELIAERGIDVCVQEPFDRALAQMAPEAFLEQVIAGALGARHVVVGYDFTFGHRRAGNADTLRAFAARAGFEVEVLEPVTLEGEVVSSTRVRRLLGDGDLDGARRLLGRDFDVDGVVVRGAGRGRGLGVPTANLAAETELLPATGIYAVWVEGLGDARPVGRVAGAASVGRNPTFVEGGELSLEVHLLDFDGDLYGKRLRIAFVSRLRDELQFASADALIEQMNRDIREVRAILRARQ